MYNNGLENCLDNENASKNNNGVSFFEKQKKKEQRKKLTLFSSIGLCVIGIGVGLVLLDPFSINTHQSTEKKVNKVAYQSKETQVSNNKKSLPVSLKQWQLTPTIKPNKDVLDKVWKHYSYSMLYDESLPSVQAGYTDDISKSVGEDGLPNPLFSYWTREGFAAQAGDIIERLVNPMYGLSVQSQRTGQEWNLDNIRWVFTGNMNNKANSTSQREYLPTLIDYDHNLFGYKDVLLPVEDTSMPYFYPNIKNITTTFNYDQHNNNYTVDATVDLEYVAWKKDNTKAVVPKSFKIKFVPNSNSSLSQRVLVDDIVLL